MNTSDYDPQSERSETRSPLKPRWQAAYPYGVMEDSKRVDAIFSSIAIGDEVYASSSSAYC
jgi:hypothetical protein